MHQRSSTASGRLPGRSLRQRLAVTGITLTISAVFWAAIYWARRDPDPLLYERLVPVTIVLPKEAGRATPRAGPVPARQPAPSASGTAR